jgi:acetyltransferase-like isoleucine patch superfamily enzyme
MGGGIMAAAHPLAVLARRRARRAGVVLEGRVGLGRGIRFDLAPGARLTLGDGVVVGDRCRFHLAPDAEVRIGAGTRLGSACAIAAQASVTVGARCLLADEVVLLDFAPDHGDVERPVREQGLTVAPVRIGDGACLGPAAVVERGGVVAPGARVAAKSVLGVRQDA